MSGLYIKIGWDAINRITNNISYLEVTFLFRILQR